MADGPEPLASRDAIKTYRYLRIGMVGTVVLLGAAIGLEGRTVGQLGRACWQTSISAYYYTPARAIFVGGLMVIGFALIMIKGRSWFEDMCLNFAGMLAPIVAVVPTADLGGGTVGAGVLEEKVPRCRPSMSMWPSVRVPTEPVTGPAPTELVTGRVPTELVKATVDNNFRALLIAGVVGLVVAVGIALWVNRGVRGTAQMVEKGTKRSLVATAVVLFIGWAVFTVRDDFFTVAHGWAAIIMFLFLIGAVVVKALEHRTDAKKALFSIYTTVGALMAFGGLAIGVFQLFGDHMIFVLEAWEIGLFAVFWIVQTAENWGEKVLPQPGVTALSP